MRLVLALFIVGFAGGITPAPLTAAAIPPIVTLRVYDSAGLSPAMEHRALEEAGRVLRPAFLAVRWRLCSGADRAACERPVERGELLLRIVRPRDGRHTPAALGTSFVTPGHGVLATVYADRIEALAVVARRDPAVLLGRATAHEIGHLLMRTSRHAPYGVMRETWTQDEVHRDRPLDWMFTAEDVVAMHRFWMEGDRPAGPLQPIPAAMPSTASMSSRTASSAPRRPRA